MDRMRTFDEAVAAAVEDVLDVPCGWSLTEAFAELRSEYDFADDGAGVWPLGAAMALGRRAYVEYDVAGGGMDVDDVAEMICAKHRGYGPKNITEFGFTGLIVRLHDKLARIEHLRERGMSSDMVIGNDESILDNLIDVVGYAVIWVLLARDEFGCPLAEDVVYDPDVDEAWLYARAFDGASLPVSTDLAFLAQQALADAPGVDAVAVVWPFAQAEVALRLVDEVQSWLEDALALLWNARPEDLIDGRQLGDRFNKLGEWAGTVRQNAQNAVNEALGTK